MQDSTVNSECGVLHVACVGAMTKRIAIAIAITMGDRAEKKRKEKEDRERAEVIRKRVLEQRQKEDDQAA
jgi:hypothetical protein